MSVTDVREKKHPLRAVKENCVKAFPSSAERCTCLHCLPFSGINIPK